MDGAGQVNVEIDVITSAGKVFRTGILMYGKRPGPREVLRWLRQR